MVVEDETELAALVGSYLERDGFEVTVSHDGARAVTEAREIDPDVIVLDLGLPGMDGVEVCRQVRTFSDAYVVMLTARSDEVDTPDRAVGRRRRLHDQAVQPARAGGSGAGDAATPTASQTLAAKTARTFGALSIDPVGRDVWLDGEPVALTRTEFDLLAALAERPRMAFSRRQLIDHVWGETWVGDEHLVDVHIGHLRRKLGDDAAERRFVRTVRGVGYRMGTGR